MSPRTALLILVLGTAPASAKYASNPVSMIRNLMINHLDMALSLSRLPPGMMSIVGRYQSRARSTAQVRGQNKNVLNYRRQIKVCKKCPTPIGFFEKEQDKNAPKRFSFMRAIIKQAVLEAMKERLSQPINQGAQRRSGNDVNSRIRLL